MQAAGRTPQVLVLPSTQRTGLRRPDALIGGTDETLHPREQIARIPRGVNQEVARIDADEPLSRHWKMLLVKTRTEPVT